MIPDFETVQVARDHRILRITLNRPDKRNALTPQMLQELDAAFAWADAQDDACVVVLRGAGDKAFCAGADLSGMSGGGFLETHEARAHFPRLFLRILKLGKPTLAAINGHCVAGGVGLAVACDLAIAKAGFKMGTPEIARGLFPFMISALILRTVSRRDAYEMMLLGETFSTERAAEIGLVNRVEAPEAFDAAVEAWAQRLAAMSPAVLRMGRRALVQQDQVPLEAAFEHLQGLITINAMLEDAEEGIQAFFEKRRPQFKGR